MYRGSLKHVLDWTSESLFDVELLALLSPVPVRLDAHSFWMPRGHRCPHEARLETFGPRVFPNHTAWEELTQWWLHHRRGANTPNWDIAFRADVDGTPGLVLVEAKANVSELVKSGCKKPGERIPSVRSQENDTHIRSAIEGVRQGLSKSFPGITIGCDKHYQLSNRIAFAWKLADLGVPTVLLYLGFIGDTGIEDAGPMFTDDVHWQNMFAAHLAEVCPVSILSAPVATDRERMWILSRSRAIIEKSPPKNRL